jgi:membrane protein YdbS with pleckstrin-like domain
MLKLDKGDLEAIAKHRTTRQKLVSSLAWSAISIALIAIAVSIFVFPMFCCCAWVIFPLCGVALALLIAYIVVWQRRYKKVLNQIQKENK